MFKRLAASKTMRFDMSADIIEESKLTDRYQTTVPSGVRKFLKLKKRDKIRYVRLPDGRIYIEAAAEAASDPAISAFLNFIEKDLTSHPERLQSFSGELHERLKDLVGDVEVDLNGPLSADDE